MYIINGQIHLPIDDGYKTRKEKTMKELYKALTTLGIKGTVITKMITTDRIVVYVDGEYFGIWDTTRKTFVD